jgi:hypothetical protein
MDFPNTGDLHSVQRPLERAHKGLGRPDVTDRFVGAPATELQSSDPLMRPPKGLSHPGRLVGAAKP